MSNLALLAYDQFVAIFFNLLILGKHDQPRQPPKSACPLESRCLAGKDARRRAATRTNTAPSCSHSYYWLVFDVYT